MADIYTHDPNRIIKSTPFGDIQAFPARPDAVSVAISLFAHVENHATKTAYISHALYLNSAEARETARLLIAAADHADKVQIAEAADLGEAA